MRRMFTVFEQARARERERTAKGGGCKVKGGAKGAAALCDAAEGVGVGDGWGTDGWRRRCCWHCTRAA